MKRIEVLAVNFVSEESRIMSKPLPNIKNKKYGKNKERARKQFLCDMENSMLERDMLKRQYNNCVSEYGNMFVDLIDYKRKQLEKQNKEFGKEVI